MFSSISNGQELKRKQPTTSHKTWLVVIREAFKVENILDRSDLRHTKLASTIFSFKENPNVNNKYQFQIWSLPITRIL